MTDEFLSVAEFARHLRIGESNAKAMLARGDVRSIKVGRRRLVPRSSIDAFVTSKLNECERSNA